MPRPCFDRAPAWLGCLALAIAAALLTTAASSEAEAGTPHCAVVRSGASVTASVQLGSGLTIAPFAVPVAVPVAPIQTPAIFYSYSSYATAATAAAASSSSGGAVAAPAPNHAAASNAGAAASEGPGGRGNRVARLVENRCGACHSPASAGGGLELVDADGHALSELPGLAIVRAVLGGSMPKGGPRLDEPDTALLLEWLGEAVAAAE